MSLRSSCRQSGSDSEALTGLRTGVVSATDAATVRSAALAPAAAAGRPSGDRTCKRANHDLAKAIRHGTRGPSHRPPRRCPVQLHHNTAGDSTLTTTTVREAKLVPSACAFASHIPRCVIAISTAAYWPGATADLSVVALRAAAGTAAAVWVVALLARRSFGRFHCCAQGLSCTLCLR